MDLVDRVAARLKLRDLRLLDTVVRWGSMAKAANQLNLSQPAVSKAIAQMEETLGVRLIDRGRQGVEPTPHGLALLRRGLAIHDELRQGIAEIEHLSDPTAGEVRVAAPEPIAAGLLTVLIAQFTRKYPRASVYVTQTPVAGLQVLTRATATCEIVTSICCWRRSSNPQWTTISRTNPCFRTALSLQSELKVPGRADAASPSPT